MDTSGASFYTVYTKILSHSCAVPACHDGSFEPDMRTLESAYYTLVDHPIIKNNASKKFSYRVVPFEPSASVLYERITNCCFVNTNDRMPFTVGDTLTRAQTDLVKNWIQSGAKDLCGNTPKMVIAPISISPAFLSFVDSTTCISTTDNRLEKISYKPFVILTKQAKMKLQFKIVNGDSVRLRAISNPVVRISDVQDNFSNATTIKLSLHDNLLEADVPTTDFKTARVYYMEVEFMDGMASHLVSYPLQATEYYNKLNWSFFKKDQ